MSDSADRVLILDFGSQVTQLIARRLRESGVYCEIWPFNADPDRIAAFGARAFVLSGGPASVHEGESPRAPQLVFDYVTPTVNRQVETLAEWTRDVHDGTGRPMAAAPPPACWGPTSASSAPMSA